FSIDQCSRPPGRRACTEACLAVDDDNVRKARAAVTTAVPRSRSRAGTADADRLPIIVEATVEGDVYVQRGITQAGIESTQADARVDVAVLMDDASGVVDARVQGS